MPDLLDEIGYSPRDGKAITSVYSAIGKEHGYMLRLSELVVFGVARFDFLVQVFDLADRYGIDGLVGSSFLCRLNYEVRSAEGRILVEQITP